MNSEYLKKSVGKYLSKALCEVAIRRPERPIEFLAYYLISLYEKDLELERDAKAAAEFEKQQKAAEKVNFEKQEESVEDIDLEKQDKSDEDLAVIREVISQMFTNRLSISMSKETDDISPATASPSITIDLDSDQALTEDEKDLSDMKVETSMPKEEFQSSDDRDTKLEEIYNIPERKASAIRENEPVTEEESKEFGTSDPFLARRNTQLFDVNFAPIGNPPNVPKPPE